MKIIIVKRDEMKELIPKKKNTNRIQLRCPEVYSSAMGVRLNDDRAGSIIEDEFDIELDDDYPKYNKLVKECIKKWRRCRSCKKKITFNHFYSRAKWNSNLDLFTLIKIWLNLVPTSYNVKFQIFCCKCFEKNLIKINS